jgi:hypothetical protein
MNPDQVFFNVAYAQFWIEVPLIYIKSGNDSICKIIGVDAKAGRPPFCCVFLMKSGAINYHLI